MMRASEDFSSFPFLKDILVVIDLSQLSILVRSLLNLNLPVLFGLFSYRLRKSIVLL
jgi:hypothetical protein